MDTWTAEQLGRLLDGDLDAAEEARLHARLEAEPALAAELESMRRLQQQVRAVADRMEPPAALEATLAPLGHGLPSAPRRTPATVRWIGIAAGLVLGVTVAVEVVRRPPEPMVAPPPRAVTPAPAAGERQLFQLKPLPTRSPADGDEPLGASERLIASPLVEPPLPDLAPLDVRGPLPEAEVVGRPEGERHSDHVKQQAVSGTTQTDAARSQPPNERRPSASGESEADSLAAAPAPAARDEHLQGEAVQRELKEQSPRHGRLLLLDGAGTRLVELEVAGVSEEPQELVVRVEGEVIATIEGIVSDLTRRSVIGRKVPGLADGRYRAILKPSEP